MNKYRLRVWLVKKNIEMMFRPVFVIVFSLVFMIIFVAILSILICLQDRNSIAFSIYSNLLLGATASFVVAIILELANNYRYNRRKNMELDELYGTLALFLQYRINEMGSIDCYSARLTENDTILDETPKDEIQVLWAHLPELIKVFKKTYDSKKEFLSYKESEALRNIKLFNIDILKGFIRSEIFEELYAYNLGQSDNYIIKSWIPAQMLDSLSDEYKEALQKYEREQAADRIIDIIFNNDIAFKTVFKGLEVGEPFLKYIDEPSNKLEVSEDSVIVSECLKGILREIEVLELEAQKSPMGYFVYTKREILKKQKNI